jgi:hypothetical protein
MQAKLPKHLQPEAHWRLSEMTLADTRSACEELRDRSGADLRAADHNSLVKSENWCKNSDVSQAMATGSSSLFSLLGWPSSFSSPSS